MLDDAVVRANKARAGGRGYQTLINETLRRGLQADAAKDDLREVVRQVIREELRALSIDSATILGAAYANIHWAGKINDGLFIPSRYFQQSI